MDLSRRVVDVVYMDAAHKAALVIMGGQAVNQSDESGFPTAAGAGAENRLASSYMLSYGFQRVFVLKRVFIRDIFQMYHEDKGSFTRR
jgi:hypothetical protein